jgi:hypothetical protein
MKRMISVPVAVALLAGVVTYTGHVFGQTDEAAAISRAEIPSGFRDWRLISVAHEKGSLNDLRAILGNDRAVDASRQRTLPYPSAAFAVFLEELRANSHL